MRRSKRATDSPSQSAASESPRGQQVRASEAGLGAAADAAGLEKPQVQFEAIFEHNPNSVVFADLERRIVRVNRQFTDLHQYTEDECLGRTTAFLYAHPEDYGETGQTRYNVDAPLQADAYVIEYRRKDGSTFFGETVGVQMRDDDGQLLGYVGVTRDLTEQLEYEAERRRMLEELERSRAFLAETERIARMGGGFLDMSTGELTWSEGLHRLYGLPKGATPSLDRSLSYFDAQGRAALEEAFERAASEGESFDFELPFEDAKHNKLWVRAAAKPVYEDGEIVQVRGFIQDITPRKQAEQAKRDFLAMVSHELRTPLTALLGTLGLMEDHHGQTSEDMEQLVAMALRNGRRLGALINDILDVEKLDAGQMTLELDLFAVRDVVEDVVFANRSFAQTYDVELRVSGDGRRSHVCIDAGRFEQVLTNLISNAVKFSPTGEIVDIEIASPSQGWVRVSVTDRGPGIPEAFHDQIFEKFTQVARGARSRARGTGLGLNIAKGLTEQMGGRIGFETSQGEGTTMYVEFPVVR